MNDNMANPFMIGESTLYAKPIVARSDILGRTKPKSAFQNKTKPTGEQQLEALGDRHTLGIRNVTVYASLGVLPKSHFLVKCIKRCPIWSKALPAPDNPCVTVNII